MDGAARPWQLRVLEPGGGSGARFGRKAQAAWSSVQVGGRALDGTDSQGQGFGQVPGPAGRGLASPQKWEAGLAEQGDTWEGSGLTAGQAGPARTAANITVGPPATCASSPPLAAWAELAQDCRRLPSAAEEADPLLL